MERFDNSNEKPVSLVERKRQEAFAAVCDVLDERLNRDIGKTFESHGREYELTSPEDCMVAFAQMMREEIRRLYDEIVAKEDYREEQAAAKLLELITLYERLIALYAELRSYYPTAAARVEAHIPSLQQMAEHGQRLWEEIQSKE